MKDYDDVILNPKAQEDLEILTESELLDRISLLRSMRGTIVEREKNCLEAESLKKRLTVASWRTQHRGNLWHALYALNQRLIAIEERLDVLVMPCQECGNLMSTQGHETEVEKMGFCTHECARRAGAFA